MDTRLVTTCRLVEIAAFDGFWQYHVDYMHRENYHFAVVTLHSEGTCILGVAKRLTAAGAAGILAPSFANGAARYGEPGPLNVGSKASAQGHSHDPSGRLPKTQTSWPIPPGEYALRARHSMDKKGSNAVGN
jgi:hypothetical protein